MKQLEEKQSLVSKLFYYKCSRCGKVKFKPAKKIKLKDSNARLRICDDCLCQEIHYLIFNTSDLDKATIKIVS